MSIEKRLRHAGMALTLAPRCYGMRDTSKKGARGKLDGLQLGGHEASQPSGRIRLGVIPKTCCIQMSLICFFFSFFGLPGLTIKDMNNESAINPPANDKTGTSLEYYRHSTRQS